MLSRKGKKLFPLARLHPDCQTSFCFEEEQESHILFFLQIVRCLGQLLVGNVFGQLVLMSIPGPEDLNGVNLLLLADLLAPFATALGKIFLELF